MQCSGHRAALLKLHWSTSCPRVILSIVLFLLSAANWLFLSYNQSSAAPIPAAWSFSHWALRAFPTGKCCWRKYFGDMEIKRDTAPGRQAAFYEGDTGQQRSGTPWWGKHATEGRRHRNNTTFGQCSSNILKWRIKAVPGWNHPAVTLQFISWQNKERKFSVWLNGKESRLEP